MKLIANQYSHMLKPVAKGNVDNDRQEITTNYYKLLVADDVMFTSS